MSLIEIKAEPELLKRLLGALTRIADALDRAYPEPHITQMKPYGPEALFQFDPNAEAELEEEESRQRENGTISSR
jgi:hypothetical protein